MAERIIEWADSPIEEVRTVMPKVIGSGEEVTYNYYGIMKDGRRVALGYYGNRLPNINEAPHLAIDVIVWGPLLTGRRVIDLGD